MAETLKIHEKKKIVKKYVKKFMKKIRVYLAHIIEQPNFRIPNPQYFVYLLDQQ